MNAVDRARAFERLASEFKFKHSDIAKKVGKSREYVTNTIRILTIPKEMLEALSQGKISEGHTRPLLMLGDRPEEQNTLFKEIIYRKLTVREAELISRKIAFERARKKEFMIDPELAELEEKIAQSLGTRVAIERRENGGKLTIDFFTNDDLRMILDLINSNKQRDTKEMLNRHIASVTKKESEEVTESSAQSLDDRSREEKLKQDNEDLYSVTNFSI